MTGRQMDKWIAHCDKYLEEKNDCIIHPIVENDFHVDILLYEPTEKHPYWKLITMGACDCIMPSIPHAVSNRNEYVMLVDGTVNLKDKDTLNLFCQKLRMVARYPYDTHTALSYGHSMEWRNEDETDEMVGAFLELPQVFDFGFLQHKAGLFQTVACLLVVLLNREELNRLMETGPQAFSESLFPPEEDAKKHFLSELKRSDAF